MSENAPNHRLVGFIGLGVMGEPICRNIIQKWRSAGDRRGVLVFDQRAEPPQRLAGFGSETAGSIAEIGARCDIIFLSLPGGPQLADVAEQLSATVLAGTTIIDLGTSPLEMTRALARRFADQGVGFADAPVARTRQAAEEGSLATMVGASKDVFARIRPLLACFATDITHCGEVGAGQIVKILNNMVLFQTVLALAEALAVARKAGLDGAVLFEALSHGSADSFALRNHGAKALLPGVFPKQAFSTRYAMKDLQYATDIAEAGGLSLTGAAAAGERFEQACAAGLGDDYWPTIIKVLDGTSTAS